jgi:peptidyl-prolyl cis-trans isomerase A (cyclophilin A)
MKQALVAVLMCATVFAQQKGAARSAGVAPAEYRVKMTTTKGVVVIDVHKDWAPKGADRFYSLVRAGFFNNSAFFRVMAGFMAQFGIAIKPEVNKEWEARKLTDDKPTGHSNTRGTLVFANAGAPNTRGTQMFINYKDNKFLDTQPAPFLPIGEVVEGMDVMDMLYSGYGDTSNKEDQIEGGGQAYLDRYMPKVDKIVTAVIVPLPKPESKAEKK